VQGKERSVVADVAKKLGLDGTYMPRSYIEQIQLEKLTAEVTVGFLCPWLVSSPVS
jgi:uridine kinase